MMRTMSNLPVIMTIGIMVLRILSQPDSDHLKWNSVPCLPCICSDKVANCSSQQLTKVPTNLPPSTQTLDLSQNLIHKLGAGNFSLYTELANLNLSHNQLEQLDKDVFVGLKHLSWLNIAWNNLSLNDEEAYPAEVFFPLIACLRHLKLNGNTKDYEAVSSMHYPDTALSCLRNLQSLAIDGLPNATFGPGFSNMTSLTNLSLIGGEEGFCNMIRLSNLTFIHMPSSLRVLNLSDCNISIMDSNAFHPVQNLDILDVSKNYNLGLHQLGRAMYGFQGSTLRELRANFITRPYIACVTVHSRDTKFFKNTSLQAIYLENNRIERIEKGVLLNMPPTLNLVSITGNDLTYGSYMQSLWVLNNLTLIQNDGWFAQRPPENYISRTPDHRTESCETITDKSECGFPSTRLEELPVRWSPELKNVGLKPVAFPGILGAGPFTFVLPPNLKEYTSRWKQLFYSIQNIHFDPNNSLTTLDLSSNFLVQWLGPITGLDHLTSLSLFNNLVSNISLDFFQNLTSLVHFNGSRNSRNTGIRYVMGNDTEGELFAPLTNLETLDLSKCNINANTQQIFRGLVNLRTLNLSYNAIFNFEINITHMRHLTTLILDNNYLSLLPQVVRDHLDSVAEHANVTVDLSFNPISCTCAHIDFLKWISNSKIIFTHPDKYTCQFASGDEAKMINIFDEIARMQKICNDSLFFKVFVGALTYSFCLLLVLAGALVYRFRWKLRYLYYSFHLGGTRPDKGEADQFEFDAFVSYSSEDDDFVLNNLVQNLETRAGLKLNVHNRDFRPGRPIPCNIVHAIQSSRHTLVVLTSHLLKSEWCFYELQMARMESLHVGRDVMLFLLYEDIPSRELSRGFLDHLHSSRYFDFPHHQTELQTEFWDRLADAVRH